MFSSNLADGKQDEQSENFLSCVVIIVHYISVHSFDADATSYCDSTSREENFRKSAKQQSTLHATRYAYSLRYGTHHEPGAFSVLEVDVV